MSSNAAIRIILDLAGMIVGHLPLRCQSSKSIETAGVRHVTVRPGLDLRSMMAASPE
jgi:hypothetical protein